MLNDVKMREKSADSSQCSNQNSPSNPSESCDANGDFYQILSRQRFYKMLIDKFMGRVIFSPDCEPIHRETGETSLRYYLQQALRLSEEFSCQLELSLSFPNFTVSVHPFEGEDTNSAGYFSFGENEVNLPCEFSESPNGPRTPLHELNHAKISHSNTKQNYHRDEALPVSYSEPFGTSDEDVWSEHERFVNNALRRVRDNIFRMMEIINTAEDKLAPSQKKYLSILTEGSQNYSAKIIIQLFPFDRINDHIKVGNIQPNLSIIKPFPIGCGKGELMTCHAQKIIKFNENYLIHMSTAERSSPRYLSLLTDILFYVTQGIDSRIGFRDQWEKITFTKEMDTYITEQGLLISTELRELLLRDLLSWHRIRYPKEYRNCIKRERANKRNGLSFDEIFKEDKAKYQQQQSLDTVIKENETSQLKWEMSLFFLMNLPGTIFAPLLLMLNNESQHQDAISSSSQQSLLTDENIETSSSEDGMDLSPGAVIVAGVVGVAAIGVVATCCYRFWKGIPTAKQQLSSGANDQKRGNSPKV